MRKIENKTRKQRQSLNAVQASISEATGTSTFTRDLLTKEEFRDRIGASSVRLVDELIRKRKIPVVRLGHRTTRIPWGRASEALARLEIRAIGQ